jgi:hypothetical protein
MDNERTTSGEYRHMDTCFLCEQRFQMGPHIYAGKGINGWEMVVCRVCYEQNWDGLVPQRHPRLIQHLKAIGVQVQLNASGWIPWPRD